MLHFIKTIFNPSMYHGEGKPAPFFEGWYYKLISADQAHRYAVIPGVIKGKKAHAFVQVLNGSTGQSTYHTFPIDQFWAERDHFQVHIDRSTFHQYGIGVYLDDPGRQLQGELHFENTQPWPVSLSSPGIMGLYAWVPAMECYHGVVSLDHTIQGELIIDGQAIDFSGGRGYIEKDWGKSFPSAWVWYQSNHFPQAGVCITASVAIIPWLRNAFRGFILGLWVPDRLYRFATYSGAKIEHLEVCDDSVGWVVRDRHHRLEMRAKRAGGGLLLGPNRVEMGKRVVETLNGTIEVRLTSHKGDLLFEGLGKHAGLEVQGDIERLLKMTSR